MPRLVLLAVAGSLLGGCASSARGPEATSFLGEPLARPALTEEFRAEQEALLAAARADLRAAPGDPEAWIWVGRRLAYLGRHRDAVAHYSRAIDRFPGDARLLRHRGHRWITLRELDRAIADLELAARLIDGSADEIEPDGLPNDRGIPTSTLHTNIHYHLGLAHTLEGDWAGARRAYLEGLEASANPDMRSAMSYWLVLALWRLGPEGEVEARLLLSTIDPDWELIENEDYYALLRAFAGDGDPRALLEVARAAGGVRFATVAYGVGAWHRQRGEADAAREIWREVAAGERWDAFGSIAAEAELARSRSDPPAGRSASSYGSPER